MCLEVTLVHDEKNYDIYKVLKDHRSRTKVSHDSEVKESQQQEDAISKVSFSDIPDIFFDRILVDFRPSRIEISVLMYIYRSVWCRPNLHREHGISPMLSLGQMSEKLKIDLQELHLALRKLESLGFIKTIRTGQYFVRRFFQKEYDQQFGQSYDDFEI